MHPLLSSLFDVWAGKDWLIAANVVLSALVAIGTLRYRRLYLQTLGERLLAQLLRGHGPLPREIPLPDFGSTSPEMPARAARRQ